MFIALVNLKKQSRNVDFILRWRVTLVAISYFFR